MDPLHFLTGLANRALSFLAKIGLERLSVLSRTRRIWRLTQPKDLVICVSVSLAGQGEAGFRPATGIGQIQALALLLPSLSRGYYSLRSDQVSLGFEPAGRQVPHDLLCIGGPRNNRITEAVLAHLPVCPFTVGDEAIVWNDTRYEAKVEEDRIVEDYGIVLRARNPLAPDKRQVVIVAGAKTFGTVAAARFFVEDVRRFRYSRYRHFAALVKAEVGDNYVHAPQCVEFTPLV